MNLKKLVAALSAVTMLGSMTVAVPASAAESGTDAEVSDFCNFRVNQGKTIVIDDTTYYCAGKIKNILTREQVTKVDDQYERNYTATTAETKKSARFFQLMRIKLNSEHTKSVSVSVSVTADNKTFAIYGFNSAYSGSDWTAKDYEVWDYEHIPVTGLAAYTTLYASQSTGYDWSGKSVSYAEQTPIQTVTTSNKTLTFTLDISDADNDKGYKDIVIVNNTSADDTTLINVGTPTITTSIYAAYITHEGTTKHYDTLQSAIYDASNGDIINLVKDVNENVLSSQKINNVDYNAPSSFTLTGNYKVNGIMYIKGARSVAIDGSTVANVRLESGSKYALNQVTLKNGATVQGTIQTDSYTSPSGRSSSDYNFCKITLEGNSSVGSIGMVSYAVETNPLDRLDLSNYTGSPVTVNIQSAEGKDGSPSSWLNPDVAFLTGDATKVTLDATTAATYDLFGGALVNKNAISYWAVTGSSLTPLTTVVINVNDYGVDKTAKYSLNSNIEGTVSVGLKISGIPDGITINSITLE